MRRIRIAQIGVNFYSHGPDIFRSLVKQSDLFEVVGYCLPENERERLPDKLAVFEGFPELTLDEILNDPTIDAVTVETDEIYTTKYALLAIEHGKHVHMEKPGGRELSDFEALIAAVKRTGKVFHTGYMYRYNPLVRDLLDKVRAGELGDIISVEAQMNCYHQQKYREWLNELPAGMMFFLGCHLVDLVMLLQGEPENIIPLNRRTGTDGVDSPDFGMAVMEYKRGVSFIKTTDVERGGYLRRQLVVTGTKGTIELKPIEYLMDDGMHTDQTTCYGEAWHTPGEHITSPAYDRYDFMMASFAAMARGECVNPYTPDYELRLYKTVLRCCGVPV